MTYEEVARKYLTSLELVQWYANINDFEVYNGFSPTEVCKTESMCISHTFHWSSSPEGFDYWDTIWMRVDNGETREILTPSRNITKHSVL